MKVKAKQKLVRYICRRSLQQAMQKLHLFALTGMNYGNANSLDHALTGEEWVIRYIKKTTAAEKDFVFFDAGANEGNYSILLSKIFKQEKIRIYAFEPAKQNFNLLVGNTTAIKNIECFNFGLSTKEETLIIYSSYEGSGATTLYKNALSDYAFNKNLSEEISLTTIDAFCSKHSIDAIHFLKIDVEGHELPVMLGGINMLQQHKIRFIQFEFGSFHIYARTFFKDFWDLLSPDYTIYRIISDGIFEIESYSENFEIFRTANFLAELKQ